MAFKLTINGADHEVDVEPETPLLWVLRDTVGLTGTKFGCGIAQCGACTVHLDGQPVRSCSTPAAAAVGREITTIEGLSPDSSHPLQRAWVERQRDRRCHGREPVSLRHLLSNSRSHPPRCRPHGILRGSRHDRCEYETDAPHAHPLDVRGRRHDPRFSGARCRCRSDCTEALDDTKDRAG